MALIDILMFSEQNEGTESFLGNWLKKPGEKVGAHEPVVEISTDKVTVEIAAPETGVLQQVLKSEGDPVAPGEILGRIETAAEQSAPVSPESTPGVSRSAAEIEPSARADVEALTPAVRRLLAEHRLDAAQIPASGRGGRITHQDVVDYIEKRKAAPETSTPSPGKPTSHKVPHTAMRRAIANHMSRSVQTAPHVTALFEADMSRVLSDRASRAEPPTVTAYMIEAAVKALRQVPEANSRWHDDALEIFEDLNIGFGAATPDGGLIVPVIHRAQHLTLMEISDRLRDLTRKAREGKLSHDEIENGTFTISNHGVSGSLLAAPIVIPNGQAAVLGVGKLQKRAVIIEATDSIAIRPMIYVTLTIDHRVLDAQQTNAFLSKFVEALEGAPHA